MFADSSLAALIDRAEGRMCAGLCRYVASIRPAIRTLVSDIAGGCAVYAGPRSPMNKMIGIGFDGPLDIDVLEEIEAEWRDRDEPVRVELSVLADVAVAPALSRRGYILHGFEDVLGRTLDHIEPATNPSVAVEMMDPADAPTWADIALAAFLNLDGTGRVADSPERHEIEEILTDMATAPGFQRYLAWIDGRPVGEANLRIDGRLAQVAGAGTLPAYRGRGVQKALLHRRLVDARAAGCELAVVTTAPGTRSQANVMRRGFSLLYARAVLIRAWS
jgi:GNAT superfamily N-acetyltransferase